MYTLVSGYNYLLAICVICVSIFLANSGLRIETGEIALVYAESVDTNGNVILNSLTARHRSLFNRNEGSGRFLYCVMTILMVNLA